MLELKIEELVTAVRELSGKLDMLTCTIAQVTTSVSPRSSDNPSPSPAPAPAPASVQQVTEHELTALCLEIVRADRSKKDEVKGVIASFGGELISDIPKDRYPELATKLKALK